MHSLEGTLFGMMWTVFSVYASVGMVLFGGKITTNSTQLIGSEFAKADYYSNNFKQTWFAAYESRVRNWAGVNLNMNRGMIGGKQIINKPKPKAVSAPIVVAIIKVKICPWERINSTQKFELKIKSIIIEKNINSIIINKDSKLSCFIESPYF